MDTPKIHESEYRFCLIMWEKEPIRSPELVRLCKERLGWKETTAYTVMKRLEERGVLKVENKIATSLFSKDQIQQAELDEFVTKTFEGSLPALLLLSASGRPCPIKTLRRSSASSKVKGVLICKVYFLSWLNSV